MTVEIGHFALVLAFALAVVQATVPMLGARLGNARLMAMAAPTAMAGFALVTLSFCSLDALQGHRHLGQP